MEMRLILEDFGGNSFLEIAWETMVSSSDFGDDN